MCSLRFVGRLTPGEHFDDGRLPSWIPSLPGPGCFLGDERCVPTAAGAPSLRTPSRSQCRLVSTHSAMDGTRRPRRWGRSTARRTRTPLLSRRRAHVRIAAGWVALRRAASAPTAGDRFHAGAPGDSAIASATHDSSAARFDVAIAPVSRWMGGRLVTVGPSPAEALTRPPGPRRRMRVLRGARLRRCGCEAARWDRGRARLPGFYRRSVERLGAADQAPQTPLA
jgi:hypothetical protein